MGEDRLRASAKPPARARKGDALTLPTLIWPITAVSSARCPTPSRPINVHRILSR